MNLNKLSYTAYGNLMLSVLLILCIVFTLIPISYHTNIWGYIFEFLLYLVMIPIYLITRDRFSKPIHMRGLNKCFIFTTSFYILLDLFIYISYKYLGYVATLFLGVLITCLATYFTSEITSMLEEQGKLFWGYKAKGEPSKYQKLIDYIKFNGLTDEYINAENLLKLNIDSKQFIVYKRIFKESCTWNEVEEELDLNRQYISGTLDRCYYYMIGRLNI